MLRSTEDRSGVPKFTLRGALTAYSIIGVILSVPLVGLGFTVTAAILVAICVLQLPLFLLFGAFGQRIDAPNNELQTLADLPEWDRWRNERGRTQ